ncbi:MAG: hypothetical protein EXR71_08725 [Myxococcales bacterium]|nr:hypothetical protein [Myxococcales bacterium]
MFRSTLPALILALSCASPPDVDALLGGVDAAAGAKDFGGAVQQAEAALALPEISAAPAKAWRFESARLNALAAAGKGADVKSSLERLAVAYPKQVTATTYLALADKVRAAGDGPGGADLLDAGLKKFPGEEGFQRAIDDMKGSADPEEIERLKALGYL